MTVDIYQITLNISKQAITDGILPYITPSFIDSFLIAPTYWIYSCDFIDLKGVIRSKKLKVTDISFKSEAAIDITKEIAKSSKGTVIAVVNNIPIFVTKGNALDIPLLDLEQGLKKVRAVE